MTLKKNTTRGVGANLARTMRFRWLQLNMSVEVDLLDDLNRELTDQLWKAAPLFSIQSHAVVAGKQIYFPSRLMLRDQTAAQSEPMNEQPPGRVNFEPFFQYVALNYAAVSEPAPAWAIGQVRTRDVTKLPMIGRQVWDNLLAPAPPFLVIVERADQPPALVDLRERVHRPEDLLPGVDWQTLHRHIRNDTEAIWLTEPEDVRALRLGINQHNAGVYDQYFSPWVMVTGLVRSLSVIELAMLVRLCDNPAFSVEQLRTMLTEMLRLTVTVVSFFGLPRLGAVLEGVYQSADRIDEPNDFRLFVTDLLTYVNRYNLWLHQSFPWHLGHQYPRPDLNDAQTRLDMASRPPYKNS